MIKIITDSSSNITQEEAKALGIEVMPLTINFGTEEFLDGVEIDCNTFYDRLANGKEFPHTSQLTEEQITACVENALKEADEVLILPIASVLSGSFERCSAVASKYPNVYAHDCGCTTVMLKTCVLTANENKDKCATEVIEILKELRPKLRLFACLDTLDNLRKGGRLSSVSAIIGSALKIKPVITFSIEGKVQMVSKQIGMNKGIKALCGLIDVKNIDTSLPIYQIYTQNDKNSNELFEKLGIAPTEKSNICPVIGTHIGADACGIVFAVK